MKLLRFRATTVAAIGLCVAVAACGGSAGSDGGSTTASSDSGKSNHRCATDKGPIKIGVTGPQSGLYAIVGDSQEAGLKLAVEELGDEGINGRKVEVVSRDDKFSPTTAVSNFQQFVNRDGICAMMGPTDTSSTKAVAESIEQLPDGPIPMIGTLGTDDVIAPDGPGSKPRPFAFGVLTGNWPELTILTEHVLKNFKGKKIAIMHDPTDYGKNQADFAVKLLKEAGVEPVANVTLPVNTPDPGPQVNKVLDAGAEVVYTLVSFDDVARVAKALRAAKSDAQIICTDQCAVIPDFVKNAGPAANGTISTKAAGTALQPTADLKAFSEKYNNMTGFDAFPPPDWSLTSYDAARMIFDVWKKVGTDPQAVFAEMEKIKGYKGLACPNLSFSPTQHNSMGEVDCYRMMIIKDEKPVLLEGQS
jgi:branched-chain amino acid transport system substrate-binding protein